MIRNSVGSIGAIMLFCATSIAQASPITWGPDIYDPAQDVYLAGGGAACTFDNLSTPCETLAYTHDLTAHGFIPGVSSDDQITGGLLEILFRDDEDDRPSEGFKISLNEFLQPGTQNAATAFSFGAISGNLLASLQNDGLLHVVIAHQHGDFVFDRSTFTAEGTHESEDEISNSPTVPEPASVILLSSGLVGAFLRRRTGRTRKN